MKTLHFYGNMVLAVTDFACTMYVQQVMDVLSNNQVASIVWKAESEQEAARAVVEAANMAWKNKFPSSKMDDCTVVCLFLQKRQQHGVLCLES